MPASRSRPHSAPRAGGSTCNAAEANAMMSPPRTSRPAPSAAAPCGSSPTGAASSAETTPPLPLTRGFEGLGGGELPTAVGLRRRAVGPAPLGAKPRRSPLPPRKNLSTPVAGCDSGPPQGTITPPDAWQTSVARRPPPPLPPPRMSGHAPIACASARAKRSMRASGPTPQSLACHLSCAPDRGRLSLSTSPAEAVQLSADLMACPAWRRMALLVRRLAWPSSRHVSS
mmetsp:Transcript_22100/g.68360  ORF Transcript_22100/g.68360 Transcript_22100/m.68360 type:complete len:228 (+) Transcript_22100:239-922(+)